MSATNALRGIRNGVEFCHAMCSSSLQFLPHYLGVCNRQPCHASRKRYQILLEFQSELGELMAFHGKAAPSQTLEQVHYITSKGRVTEHIVLMPDTVRKENGSQVCQQICCRAQAAHERKWLTNFCKCISCSAANLLKAIIELVSKVSNSEMFGRFLPILFPATCTSLALTGQVLVIA